MVASYRCNEIKGEVMAILEPGVEELNAEVCQKYCDRFPQTCKQLLTDGFNQYGGATKNYPTEVSKKVKEELMRELLSRMETLFLYQLKHVNNRLVAQFKEEASALIQASILFPARK